MKGSRWLPGATLGLTLVLAAPVAAQQPEVVSLRFEGNDAFNRTELSSAIVTQQSQCGLFVFCLVGWGVDPSYLDPGALEADVFRLRVYYYERGYRQAEIEADTVMPEPDEVRVTFRIQEGRSVRVTRVDIEGLPTGLSGRSLPLRAGRPFDVVAYEATRDTLQSRLWDSGYAHGQVLLGYTIRSEAPYEATVRYTVYPGTLARFGRIDVQGTEETTPRLVHRMLTFEEGDLYRRRALLRSQRNLYGLQIFRHADVQADLESPPDSVVPVAVRVVEGNMRRIRVGAGANNMECVNLEGQWTSRNFMGDGRRLTFSGRIGNLFIDQCGFLVNSDYASSYDKLTGLVSADFTQPWLFGPRNNVGIGLFAERRNVPDVFVRSAVGGYLSLSHSLGGSSSLTLAYRPELTKLETGSELFFCVNFVACTFAEGELTNLQAPHWLAPVTLSYTVDRTNALFTPSRGFIVRLDLEYAARHTGSDFAYTRLLGESSWYLGKQGGVVLATRVRGGVGYPHKNRTSKTLGLNPQKRFFAGGANSVRGFGQYRLGPTVLGVEAIPWLVNGPTADQPGVGCTEAEVNDGTCDASGLPDRRFDPRPVGGEVMLEGNIELRFPTPLSSRIRGALFVDAGQVWQKRTDLSLSQIIATPGFGLRYQSPIGPIRVDAAFNPQGPVSRTVLTTEVGECSVGTEGCFAVEGRLPKAYLASTGKVVDLKQEVSYGKSLDEITTLGDFLNRFQLHFSIGQAF